MIKFFEKKQNRGGYAILELLFYLALFTTLSLVVIDAMIVMAKSFKETSIQADFVQSGNIMERISREIRKASNIPSISATDLKLDTVEFKLSGPNLEFYENNVLTGNLNAPNISVTALAFSQITTAKGKAVSVVLSVKSNNDTLGRVENFQDTVVLRGSYQ